MSWEHHIDTICCIVGSRLSLLRRIKPYLHFGSALGFSNPCVKKYFIFVLLPGETAPTISSYDSFVFRSVLGVYSLMPTSLRLLFINVWNWRGSPFFISLNTGNFFFSAFSFIPMLLIASGTDFDFLFDSRGPLSCYTRASLFDLKVPYPQCNPGKRTHAYSATKFFNDLKEFSASSSPLLS